MQTEQRQRHPPAPQDLEVSEVREPEHRVTVERAGDERGGRALADSGNESRNNRLYAATGDAPSHCSGEAIHESPSSVSEKAIAPRVGKNIGAFHHVGVSGIACAFHHRIQVLRMGSPRSFGSTRASRAASGQVWIRVIVTNSKATHTCRVSSLRTWSRQAAFTRLF
jgi:hypothetical protein